MRSLSFYRHKKVFITGVSGFKGSWLAHTLLAAGAEITGFALAPPELSLFTQTRLADDIRFIAGDVRDGAALARAFKDAEPSIVFHLAAQPLVRRSYREPALTYETNVMGTVNILEALRASVSPLSFVNVTTDKVYENREWYWGYRENEPLNGYDPYSNSKSCSELVTASYRSSFFTGSAMPALSTARSGNVIGGGDYAEDRIIPDCIRAAHDGKQIIVRNPLSTRPYQHVLDCLSGYLLLAEKQTENCRYCGAWNFGPDDESCVSTGELAELFCKMWGGNASWTAKSDGGPHEAAYLKLDCSKAKSVLGWKPRWNITQAVQKTVEAAKMDGAALREGIKWQIEEYYDG